MLAAGLRVVRRPVPDPDAARDDDRRAGAALQRAVRHRRRARGGAAARAGAARCTGTTRGCRGCMPSPNMPTLDTADRLPGHACCSRARSCRKGAARRARSSWSGAPWIDAERVRRAAERAADRRARTSGPSSSSRPSRSTRTLACGGVPDPRAPIGARSGRSWPASAADGASSTAARPTGSPGASRPTSTSTTGCRSTSSPARIACARAIEADVPARDIADGAGRRGPAAEFEETCDGRGDCSPHPTPCQFLRSQAPWPCSR